MFTVSTKTDIGAFVDEIRKQVRFAGVVALTRTGVIAKNELAKEMGRVFDRPTPYTLNSVQLRPATKENPSIEISFREFGGKGTAAWKYLGPQIVGGARQSKRFETSLAAAGLMPSGMFAVPGPAADLDSYGNMSRGQIVKILSDLQASSDGTQNRGQTRSRGVRRDEFYFVGGYGRAAHLKPGIYLRADGGRIHQVVRFTRSPNYRSVFDPAGVVARTVEEHFQPQFEKALEEAFATAR